MKFHWFLIVQRIQMEVEFVLIYQLFRTSKLTFQELDKDLGGNYKLMVLNLRIYDYFVENFRHFTLDILFIYLFYLIQRGLSVSVLFSLFSSVFQLFFGILWDLELINIDVPLIDDMMSHKGFLWPSHFLGTFVFLKEILELAKYL